MQREDYEILAALEANLWWFAGMREVTASLLDPILPRHLDRRILDAGCGTGGNLKWLEAYAGNGKVIGIDLVSDALNFCTQHGSKNLAQASVTHLPFSDSSFDVVSSFDVLVQLPGEDSDMTAIGEMYRVLRPGGSVFVRVAAYDWMRSSHDEALGTQHRYSLPELQRKLEYAGFRVRRSTYANFTLLPLAALNRLVLKRLGLTSKGSDVKPLPSPFQWLDGLFKTALALEGRWLSQPGASLPAGLSAICIAEKPVER
ncbi:MAG TPA: class I SAM-dependent methyltransferase [Pyrinomonadaceae bacterium]|nr:class I SAM-dependent methyltransferase [Pyrinomonadaceae bacterium]